jgi:dihydrofolate synthase/folylpolyglutamate synthase
VFVPLHGAHQGENAAVALTAVEAFFAAPLEEEIVHEGFANVEVPGRFEVMGVQPLAIIDGAHNPPGADVCASVFFNDFQPDGRRVLVMGTLRDPAEMLAALRADEFDVVHACTAPSPRGIAGTEVAKAARQLGAPEVYVHDTVEAACVAAMNGADADDAILATGSIYVAGAARPALRHLTR